MRQSRAAGGGTAAQYAGETLSTNTGTAYRGLRCSRREFDQVASLRVEGVSISSTARVTGHSRTTIARWLERASTAAACFNHRMLCDFDVIELQADELCTFIGSKRHTLWLFATIEVCSRLWAGSVLGRRSYRNTKGAINDVILRGRLVGCPLIATDGGRERHAVREGSNRSRIRSARKCYPCHRNNLLPM